MKLSKRLERLAGMVTEGNRLADVGTDHGYVPICLCEQGKIPSAIAMDISEGPLSRARAHIQEAGLTQYIETRRSDGLTALREGEVDTVLIAGMGGMLMERILYEGRALLSEVRELILQPQSELAGIRQWLERNGWRLVCEDVVYEDGKYYFPMRAVQGKEADFYTIAEYRYGRLKYQQSLPVLEQYLKKRLEVNRDIFDKLPRNGKERTEVREWIVKRDIRFLEEALEGCIGLQKKEGIESGENMSGTD